MSRGKKNEVMVGSFTVAGLALLLLLVFLMGGLDGCMENTTDLRATFRDVQGLQAGDPVYLFGVRCGRVRAIELRTGPEDGRAEVVVTLTIPAEFRQHLRTTTRVSVDRTLTGNLSILVRQDPQDAGAPLAKDGVLAGIPATDLSTLTAQARGVLGGAEETIGSIAGIVGELESSGQVETLLADLSGLTSELRGLIAPLKADVRESLDLIDGTLEKVGAVVDENRETLKSTLTALEESAQAASKLLAELESTPDELEASLVAVRRAATDAGELIGENREHLDSILADLDTTASNASNLTSEVKRRPWRLLYKPSLEEQQGLELYDAAWAYNLATTELKKSARDLARTLGASAEADAGEPGTETQRRALEEVLARVRESLEREKRAEELFWKRLETAE